MVVRAGPLAWAALRLFPLVGPLLIISAIAIVQYDTNLNATAGCGGCGPESTPAGAPGLLSSQDPWLFNTYQGPKYLWYFYK